MTLKRFSADIDKRTKVRYAVKRIHAPGSGLEKGITMALNPAYEIIKDALPETGEIPFTELREKLTTEGKGRSLAEIHEARRAGVIYSGFREGVLVYSRFPIAREARRVGLSAGQGAQG